MTYLVLWFDINDEWVASLCDERDIKRGAVRLNLVDDGRRTTYSIGYHPIRNCGKIGKFDFGHELPGRIKWDDRNKLFEKYPELKQLCA